VCLFGGVKQDSLKVYTNADLGAAGTDAVASPVVPLQPSQPSSRGSISDKLFKRIAITHQSDVTVEWKSVWFDHTAGCEQAARQRSDAAMDAYWAQRSSSATHVYRKKSALTISLHSPEGLEEWDWLCLPSTYWAAGGHLHNYDGLPEPAQKADDSSATTRDAGGPIQRSEAAKRAFMRATEYPSGRPGYVVDHIKPLACGGPDDPSNMQWQTIDDAKEKDRWERAGCR
jgi:hypothetical protein